MSGSAKRLAVFSIKKWKGGSMWVRAGAAFVNKDGSMNIRLDVLPLDGQLHVREAAEKQEEAGMTPAVPETGGAEMNAQMTNDQGMEVQP